jgi:REP element-mobilizing transposase RayT
VAACGTRPSAVPRVKGNNRQQVFFSGQDRLLYLALLKAHAERFGLQILGYCLMSNHMHLVGIPAAADSLARAIGRTDFRYTGWEKGSGILLDCFSLFGYSVCMPRRRREATGGLVYHVLNRAVRRTRLFDDDADYVAFERVVEEACGRLPTRILTWFLRRLPVSRNCSALCR